MKRTSPWLGSARAVYRVWKTLVLLALMPGISEAYGYGSYHGAVRYSPYALSYRSSGLVSGCVDYTPYALDYRSSGLVSGYGVYSDTYVSYAYPTGRSFVQRAPRVSFRPPRPPRRHVQNTSRPVRPPDGMDIIRQHLEAKGFTSLHIDHILRIDNQLVSVDVLVGDRNLLVKYWNPQAIQELSTKEEFKQKTYENYQRDSMRVVAQHEEQGREIYRVEAADAQTIVAALDACTRLDPGLQTPDRTVMYAKE